MELGLKRDGIFCSLGVVAHSRLARRADKQAGTVGRQADSSDGQTDSTRHIQQQTAAPQQHINGRHSPDREEQSQQTECYRMVAVHLIRSLTCTFIEKHTQDARPKLTTKLDVERKRGE